MKVEVDYDIDKYHSIITNLENVVQDIIDYDEESVSDFDSVDLSRVLKGFDEMLLGISMEPDCVHMWQVLRRIVKD